MGHVPPPPPPWLLTISQQSTPLERTVTRRRSRLPWRRRAAHQAVVRLTQLREHDLYGWHSISHAGGCGRGGGCGPKPPPKPIKPAAPTWDLR